MKKLFEMPTVEVEVLVSAETVMTEGGSGTVSWEEGADYWN